LDKKTLKKVKKPGAIEIKNANWIKNQKLSLSKISSENWRISMLPN